MDRNRDGRRGNMAAMNGLSRRRPRTGSLRDSPEEDGGMVEMQESTRLRDRGVKKDRDRDRSSRSKRRRGDRMVHGSNREEGEDSTDESMDEEDEEEDDDSGTAVRLPPPPPLPPNPSPQSSALPANHNHRKSLPAKVIRPPPVWKVADEMIGVSVPRKARSASAKRSHECWLSGSGGGGGGSGGGGGGGEQVLRQPSTSPSRPSQAAAAAPAPISPSSANASVRKKTKQICGSKSRPPKISKSASSIQEIEFEVAEVLYGLTRQFQAPPKQESQMSDSKDANGSCTETKSRASSPNSISPSPAISQSPAMPPQNFSPLPIVAPKRKRPRPVKFEDESPTSPPNHTVLPSVPAASTSKAADGEQPKMEAPSPKSEKTAPTPAENGEASLDLCSQQVGEAPADVREELKKPDIIAVSDVKPPVPELECHDRGVTKEESSVPAKEPVPVGLDANDAAATAVKTPLAAECLREKFKIDLMAPPPGKSSPERDSDFVMDDKSDAADVEMEPKIEPLKADEERCDRTIRQETREVWREEKGGKSSLEALDTEKPIKKETSLDLQPEIEKHDKDGINVSKQPGLRQQPKVTRAESKPDKSAQAGSLPLPVPIAGWPGSLPFGYMGQVPSLQAVVPMDSGSVAPKGLQAQHFPSQQLRPKRCATHCYIAQNICYHQLARINPFWSAAAGSTPLYGAKPYNLNVMPTADSPILSNPLQASFPVRGLQDKVAPVVGSFPSHPSKEKGSPANFVDAAQRNQIVLQQPLQAGSTSNMLPAPAFIFPINQPQAALAATATSRTPHVKSTNVNVASSSNGSGSAAVGSGSASTSTPAVSFNYANLPQGEAQYLVLQNHGYPFPIPAHVGAPPYGGGNHPQAMPFFSGSLYAASQMLHPSQLRQQQQPQPQQPPPAQQGPQNASTSTGSSSSQKRPQHSQKAPGANATGADGPAHGPTSKQRQHLPSHQQARHMECETGSEDCPSTADSRVSQSQKGIYNHNFVMPPNLPNFALMSTAAALNSGVNHNDKLQQHPPPSQQHRQQSMKVELAPSQAFAMSLAAFGVPAASGHHGLDSATAQNHPIFQSLPDMARHGYQLSAPAAAAQAAQHKKAQQQHPEGGKFPGESMSVSVSGEEERKTMLAGKASSVISQHSLSFSRPDSDPSGSALVGNNVIDSSTRTLNLISASVNGGQVHSRPESATPAAVAASSASGGALIAQQQQQQQHLIQLQKQHQQQQQLQMQQQLTSRAKPAGTSNSSVGMYSDRLPAGTAMPKFPNHLTGFPQGLIQASNPTQSPQWKNSARNSTSMPSPAPNPTPPVKTHLPQQQGRTSQPAHLNVGLHSQISFGMNSMKTSSAGQQQQLAASNSIQTSVSVSAAATSVGSPPTSVSKGAGGSPRASSVSKTGPPNTTLPLQQPTMSKSSAAGPSRKSSPVSNRNVPPILGQPHIVASPGSVAKSQQQHQQLQLPLQQQQQSQQQQLQLQKHQQFPPQIFFTNPYLPSQSPHSSAAAAAAAAAAASGYHQRRPSEHQQQPQPPQPNSPSVSTGMLSLCAPAFTLAGTAAATSDPAKAVAAAAAAANSVKGLPSPNLLRPPQFTAAGAAHPASGSSHAHMSASGFPYSHAMPSVSVKPAEQKPAAGNDTLHACWQPEKR